MVARGRAYIWRSAYLRCDERMTGPATAMTSGAMTGQIEASRVRRQIGHDINHELATIRLLTLLLADAPELGPESRRRVALILGETRWLEQLYRAYESAVDPQTDPAREARAPISVDDVVAEVVDTMRQARMTRIGMATVPIDAHVDRLALWRVLRNIIDNATQPPARAAPCTSGWRRTTGGRPSRSTTTVRASAAPVEAAWV